MILVHMHHSEKNFSVIKYELVALLYANYPVVLVSTFIIATIVYLELLLSNTSGPFLTPTTLTLWYLIAIIVLFMRYKLLLWYDKTKSNKKKLAMHYYLFSIGALLTSASFGILISILMPNDIAHQAFVLIIVSGIIAGATQSLNSDYVLNILYLFVILIPLLLWEALQIYLGNTVYIGIFIAMMLFGAFSILVARRNYKVLIHNIRLKHSNLRMSMMLEKQATHDLLTGLFNRYYLLDYLDLEIIRSKRKHGQLALLMLDIDGFKHFNDSYGHDVGDKVLSEVGHFLMSSIRGNDVVCRYGGDEFILILTETDREGALKRAEQMLSSQSPTILLPDNTTEKINFSIGISLCPENGDTPDALIKSADMAMYRAKQKRGIHLSLAEHKPD